MRFHALLIKNFLKGHNAKKGRLKILVSEKKEYSFGEDRREYQMTKVRVGLKLV